MSPNKSTDAGDQRQLDEPLSDNFLFTKSISDALMRNGIITLRLLIMHSATMLQERIRSLKKDDIEEINAKLGLAGWHLAKHADPRHVSLVMNVVATLHATKSPVQLSQLLANLEYSTTETWTASEVRQILAQHPCFHAEANNTYRFVVYEDGHEAPVQESPQCALEDSQLIPELPRKSNAQTVRLQPLWQEWSNLLSVTARKVLIGCYGVEDGTPMKLHEVGDELGITKERVRQLREAGLKRLRLSPSTAATLHAARELLASALYEHNNLLTSFEWDNWLEKQGVWEEATQRPSLLHLFCAVLPEFTYLKSYDLAVNASVTKTGIDHLDCATRRVLRQHGSAGLSAEELVYSIRQEACSYLPEPMLEKSFLLKSVDLFRQIARTADNRYYYQRNKVVRRAEANTDWAGRPGTRLYEWEAYLRAQFVTITWIGQINLTQRDFLDMCNAIQTEAREPNYFTKIIESQPQLVPPAVFATTMVLSARYAELKPSEAIDEFWTPYLRTVWSLEYSKNFYARCKKRFNQVTSILEEAFDFDFPRTHKDSEGVVTPLFRHALIPNYMQGDFAHWICKNWESILIASGDQDMLSNYLQQDKSLAAYSQRLHQFITGRKTMEAAIPLITNMAAAISLYRQDRESPTAIAELLSGTPIEKELWGQIQQQLDTLEERITSTVRTAKSKLTWIWSLDKDELNLRVQNVVVRTDTRLEGVPDRLVWLASSDSDPVRADIEVEVTPWRMKTGERIIHDAVFQEADGPVEGCIVLLTDTDEIVQVLDVPPHPGGRWRFFRLAQQDTYGVPVELNQITQGEWLVCAEGPLTFIDDLDEPIIPTAQLTVPYPLDRTYRWAARLNLTLPAKIIAEDVQVDLLDTKRGQEGARLPFVVGDSLISGLSPWIQPTFATNDIALHIDGDGERLLKQVTLWVQGQDGWRDQRTLAELRQCGDIEVTADGLQIDLTACLPLRPNLYSLELRESLRPIYPVPLLFAVVPGLAVEPPRNDCLYTPVNPPSVSLKGIDESCIVRDKGLVVTPMMDGGISVTWLELRHDLFLSLRFGNSAVSLGWSVPRFAAWLDPRPPQAFVTLEELQRTTLLGTSAGVQLDSFDISIPGQVGRRFPLQRGRYRGCLGQTQLYDMLRHERSPRIPVTITVHEQSWRLADVHTRPELPHINLQYDRSTHAIYLATKLQEEWPGDVRFLAESVVNPFASIVELGRTNALRAQHVLPVTLPNGVYQLQVELDGSVLPLAQDRLRFRIGKTGDEIEISQRLIDEVRSGRLISGDMAEDFVLKCAMIADREGTELTSVTLYQLATVPTAMLDNFTPIHLQRLWAPLASIRRVSGPDWEAKHSLLPAWIFLTKPVILRAANNGHRWPVYPVLWGRRGRHARGYAHWYLSPIQGSPKHYVYVEWEPAAQNAVLVKAALPSITPLDLSTADLLNMYDLYFCTRCGNLCGAPEIGLPESIKNQHCHGHSTSDLKSINVPEEYEGYALKAEWNIDSRGDSLVELYLKHGVLMPSAVNYLPEPIFSPGKILETDSRHEQLATLVHNLIWHGASSNERSPLASAARLLKTWHDSGEVSSVGLAATAIGTILRFAANYRGAYAGLRKSLELSESEIRDSLTLLNTHAPGHLDWGLTWAELIMTHSLPTPA